MLDHGRRLFIAARLTDNFQARKRFEEPSQPIAKDRLLVSNDDPNRFGASHASSETRKEPANQRIAQERPAWSIGGGAARKETGRRSAADATVIVLRTQALEERDRIRERLHSLHRTIRHVHGGLARATHRLHIGTF